MPEKISLYWEIVKKKSNNLEGEHELWLFLKYTK